MTSEELTTYYVGLLPFQFSGPAQPNVQATAALLATEVIASQIVSQVLNGFALTNLYGQTPAVGAQLNILGQFVGAIRILNGYSPSIAYFGMRCPAFTPSDTTGGFGNSATIPPSDYWDSTSSTVGSYTLSDSQMIQLILYLAQKNNLYFSLEAIDNLLYSFFGSYVTVTEGPMSLSYSDAPNDPSNFYGIVKFLNQFPRPAGVSIAMS